MPVQKYQTVCITDITYLHAQHSVLKHMIKLLKSAENSKIQQLKVKYGPSLFQDGNIPQEVEVNGGEFGLYQSPETPEEMRCLENGGRKDQHVLQK